MPNVQLSLKDWSVENVPASATTKRSLVDYYPNDEDQLCLHIYPTSCKMRYINIGKDIHVSDISTGCKWKQGLYRFPFHVPSVSAVRAYGTCDYTEAFYEGAIALFEDDLQIESELRRLRWMEAEAKRDKNSLDRFYERIPAKRKPYTHQKVMREFGCFLSTFPCFSEMGTGKTQALAEVLWWRVLNGSIDKALVICPLSLLENWEREVNDLTDLCATALTSPNTKGKIDQLEWGFERNQVFIVNYESVSAIFEWLDSHFDWNRTYVIADESTKIKNPSAKRSKAVHKIGRLCRYKASLSGAPVTQGAWDVYSQFLYLDGGESFGSSYENFKLSYFYSPRPGVLIPRSGAEEVISDKIYKRGLRFLKEECLDLPEKQYHKRYVKMSPFQDEVYRKIQDDAIASVEGDIEITAPIILTELLRLSQITSGHVNGKRQTEEDVMNEMIAMEQGFQVKEIKKTIFFDEQPKIDMLKQLLFDEFPDKQLVVWTRFVPEHKLITDMLDEQGIPYSSFKLGNRQEQIDKFQERVTRVFVGNPASAAHGITLTASHIAVYMSNSFSLEQRTQSEDRIHRIGQSELTHYIDIVCKGTVDEKILQVLRGKYNMARKITRDNFREFL